MGKNVYHLGPGDPRDEPPLAEPDDYGAGPSTNDSLDAVPWARPVTWAGLDQIPPRQWLYGTKFIRGFSTVFASPGGVGKTAFSFAAGVAMASGLTLLRDKPHRPLRVWLYNMEDPYDELRRRLKAALLHFDLDPDQVLPNFLMNSGKDQRGDGEDGCLTIARQSEDGSILVGPDVQKLIREVKRLEIDVFWCDPMVMTHDVDESDNGAQERVMREFNRVATEGNCAIGLNHHTRKGFIPGDQDSIRGAGATIAAARAGFTLAPMSEKDGGDMGVDPEERRFLVRIDDAKMNLAPRSDKANWVKLSSHNLGNGTADYPYGDNVQVVTPWDPPEAARLSTPTLNEILDDIDRGPGPAGLLYMAGKKSTHWAGKCFHAAAERRGVKVTDQFVSTFINDWLKNGVLVDREFKNLNRKTVMGVVSSPSNRPGKTHEIDG